MTDRYSMAIDHAPFVWPREGRDADLKGFLVFVGTVIFLLFCCVFPIEPVGDQLSFSLPREK